MLIIRYMFYKFHDLKIHMHMHGSLEAFCAGGGLRTLMSCVIEFRMHAYLQVLSLICEHPR